MVNLEYLCVSELIGDLKLPNLKHLYCSHVSSAHIESVTKFPSCHLNGLESFKIRFVDSGRNLLNTMRLDQDEDKFLSFFKLPSKVICNYNFFNFCSELITEVYICADSYDRRVVFDENTRQFSFAYRDGRVPFTVKRLAGLKSSKSQIR